MVLGIPKGDEGNEGGNLGPGLYAAAPSPPFERFLILNQRIFSLFLKTIAKTTKIIKTASIIIPTKLLFPAACFVLQHKSVLMSHASKDASSSLSQLTLQTPLEFSQSDCVPPPPSPPPLSLLLP